MGAYNSKNFSGYRGFHCLQTAPTIPEFERRLARGEYDFAYMNPYHYVVFSKLANYAAFAKQKNKRITGVLVTAKDSKIQSVNDLRGTKLVFPSPGAFAATILTQAYLTQQGIGFSSEYVGSHDSVYLNVATKRFAAGGGISRTLNSAPPEVKGKLKVLWLSPGYTPHAFAAHTRVPADVVQAVEQSMVNFHATVKGQALLSQIRFKAIEKASSVQWDDVRSLGINPEKALSLINAD